MPHSTNYLVFVAGFGLYFEWKKSDTTEMTIHVAESEEEDELDDEEHGKIYICLQKRSHRRRQP